MTKTAVPSKSAPASLVTYTLVPSPLGELRIGVADGAVVGLYMDPHRHAPAVGETWVRDDREPLLVEVVGELAEYFAGDRTSFDVPVRGAGTAFQQQVWAGLCEIPYGVTISYGELAERIGNPAAVRAVGLANGKNPVSIIVPCHRVIGANGSLTGYGGGLDRKRYLLDLESGQRPLSVG